MTMRDSELMKSLESDPVGWAVAASAEIERLWDTLALANEQLESLRIAIREANEWLKAGEGVDLLYYWPSREHSIYREVLADIIHSADAVELGPEEEPAEHRFDRESEVAREVIAARRAGMSKEAAIAELTILNLDPLTASRMWDAADRSSRA